MKNTVFLAMLALLSFIVATVLSPVWANYPSSSVQEDKWDKLGGHVEATIDGKRVLFPLLENNIHADVQGDLVSVTLTQTYKNPSENPVHATYLFPMNKDAAVYAMTMETRDEIVRAKIKKKEKAKKIFEKAKKKGQAASLLVQHRPNMFTQNLANLMPGEKIKITLKYTHPVPKVDGEYELVIPMIVGPRYESPDMKTEDKTPVYPDVAGLTIPDNIDFNRVAINVNMASDIPIQRVVSPTHKIVTETRNDKTYVSLRKGKTIDNQDFVLHYNLAGTATQAGMMTYEDKHGEYFSLLLEPPAMPKDNQVTPREMVFVLDASGSMSGLPMNASKTFMINALDKLRPTDYFRIIQFSNSATEYSQQPLLATPENIQRGKRYVKSLSANGGTEVRSGINQALDKDIPKDTMRIVVFLTDGYIGNETDVLNLLNQKVGNSRLYALGVGAGVNRFLLDEMGKIGRGFTRYIDSSENPEAAAKSLAARLESPVFTNISINWGQLGVTDQTPHKLPDLFAGDSVRIVGKFAGSPKAGQHKVLVSGFVHGKPVTIPVTVDTKDMKNNTMGESIPLIWARTRIEDHMSQYRAPGYLTDWDESGKKEIEKAVTELGLDYSLMTKWTSFVAVTEKKVNKNPDKTLNTKVPLPMVDGVTSKAYGSHEDFYGASVPEPEQHMLYLALIALCLGILTAQHRRKKPASVSVVS